MNSVGNVGFESQELTASVAIIGIAFPERRFRFWLIYFVFFDTLKS